VTNKFVPVFDVLRLLLVITEPLHGCMVIQLSGLKCNFVRSHVKRISTVADLVCGYWYLSATIAITALWASLLSSC
jgi:hypothetical protein